MRSLPNIRSFVVEGLSQRRSAGGSAAFDKCTEAGRFRHSGHGGCGGALTGSDHRRLCQRRQRGLARQSDGSNVPQIFDRAEGAGRLSESRARPLPADTPAGPPGRPATLKLLSYISSKGMEPSASNMTLYGSFTSSLNLKIGVQRTPEYLATEKPGGQGDHAGCWQQTKANVVTLQPPASQTTQSLTATNQAL
jgi:hypothetical protein